MLKNRFLSVFVLAFAAGIAMPFLLGTGMEAVAFVVSLCIFLPFVGIPLGIFLITKRYKTLLLYVTFAGIGLLLGTGWLWVRSLPYDEYIVYEDRADVLEGTVTESGSSIESSYLEIKVEKSHIGLPAGTKIRLYGKTDENVRIGDTVRANCEYGKVAGNSYRANNVALVANGTVVSHVPGDSPLDGFRNVMLDACEALYASYDSVGVAQALTLRERSQLPYETGDGYRNAGVAHLLAISGLHLSILIALIRRLLMALRLRKVTRECIALAIILLYCILTGFSPSIVRAAVMLSFVLVGELLLDETDSLTVLFFALFLLLAFNPYALLSVGLQLSFLSCLGIMVLEPYVSSVQKRIRGDKKAKRKKLRKLSASLIGAFLISAGAVVFTFPVTTLSFGNLSYLAPVSNLIFVPLFTPILALLLFSVLLYPLLPFLGYALALLPGLALQGMDRLFGALSDAGIGSIFLEGAWLALPVALATLAIAAMLFLPKRAIRVFSICAVCAMITALGVGLLGSSSTLTVKAVVSSAEGYVFVSDGEFSAFADVGELPTGRPKVLGSRLDAYVVTKADERSLGRLQGILQDTEIAYLYLPISDDRGMGNDLSSFQSLADKYGCTVHEYGYALETELLSLYVRDRRILLPDGLCVLLEGGVPSQADVTYVLFDKNVDVSAFHGEASFFLPSEDKETPQLYENVQYYRNTVTFANGEVTQP